MTNEQKVFESLEQKNFYVVLGGQQVEMSPLTLSMFDEMGALSSLLPIIEDVKDDKIDISSLMPLSGNGETLSKILFVSAKNNIKSDLQPEIFQPKWYHRTSYVLKKQKELDALYPQRLKEDLEQKKKALYDLIYTKTTFIELQTAIIQIFSRSNAFFLHNCITTLRNQNRLKPTKETDQTAHTQ